MKTPNFYLTKIIIPHLAQLRVPFEGFPRLIAEGAVLLHQVALAEEALQQQLGDTADARTTVCAAGVASSGG